MLIHHIQPDLSPKFPESLKLDTADVTVYHPSNVILQYAARLSLRMMSDGDMQR